MKNISWFVRLTHHHPSSAKLAAGLGAVLLLAAAGSAAAQSPEAPTAAPDATMSVPAGYSAHSSVDVGGRMTGIAGSGSMYDTLVNLHSGPRVLGQTFELHALPGNKHTVVDDLQAFSSGFGGEPYNFSKLDFSKGKIYEFSGMFRRDRQYFDYDLLGNPDLPGGYSIPIGPSAASTGSYAWPQVIDSPFMFNTVRRMTDTSLTLMPLSKVTYRFAYSQNIMQGPSLTPSGYQIAGSYAVLLQEMQRNSTDDFTAALDWKPIQGTKLTYEEQIDHYKGDSYFVMDPSYFTAQEANGTKVALLANYQSYLPYGYSSATGAFSPGSNCNASGMANATAIFSANPAGGLPIIDPACNVITSYFRSQPIREYFPTEIFRLQSSSLKNVAMNGDFRYTDANMNLANYYDQWQGFQWVAATSTAPARGNRELAYTGDARARRQVVAADYGIVWQAGKTVSLSDQVTFSNFHQPGVAALTAGTTETIPSTAGTATVTINNPNLTVAPVAAGTAPIEGTPGIGATDTGYLGQRLLTNNATITWDATARSTFSLTYRHTSDVVDEGASLSAPVQTGVCPAGAIQAFCGTVTTNVNGGIVTAALRPTSNWNVNGSVEMLYADNAFTPVAPRQTQHYRIHTLYRPTAWATFSGAFNDLERHNNTNNTGVAPPSYVGPLNHVDHSRFVSLGANLFPNEHYGLDVNYAYSDVYTATNTCFQGGATLMPGNTNVPGAANQSGLLCGTIGGTHGISIPFGARDFMDAPTQYGSVALALSPVDKFHSNVGYRISSVNGSRFFQDAQDVNGSLVSTYQTPFVNVAYTVHPGLIWKAEYNYFGYGEGGRSGAAYCNANPALASGAAGTTVTVVPCSAVPNTAMSGPVYGFTAPRNFHANNVILGMHYEF